MEVSQKFYLKRKIDASMYQKLILEKQKSLVGLEAQLQHIYEEENVSQIVKAMKSRISGIELQRKREAENAQKQKDKNELDMAEEIALQVK